MSGTADISALDVFWVLAFTVIAGSSFGRWKASVPAGIWMGIVVFYLSCVAFDIGRIANIMRSMQP